MAKTITQDTLMDNLKSEKHGEEKEEESAEWTALKPKLESFDDILPHVGDFGPYQWRCLLALFPYSAAYAALYFSQFFLTLVPKEHWCKVDSLLDSNLTASERIKLAIPASPLYPYYDVCHQKDLNFSRILQQGEQYNSTLWHTSNHIKCNEWEFDFSKIPYSSLGVELNWVCDKSYLISSAQSLFFLGAVAGSLFFGWLADNKGRLPALVICSAISLIASVATSSTNDFWSFAITRFISGLAFENVSNIPLIIVVEYMAVSKRSLVINVAFGVYFAIVTTATPWVAYYVADWRYFNYIMSIPLLLCIFGAWVLPESIRWYISKGKTEKVMEKLTTIARLNKKDIDPKLWEEFRKRVMLSKDKKHATTFLDLFKTPRISKHVVLLTLLWGLTCMAFDGHVYTLKFLENSVFVSFSLACATELPAGLILVLILDRWGRRFCTFMTMAMTTVFTFMELLLVSSTAKLVLSILCRFCLNMAANIGLQYVAELLPTPVRSQGVAVIHTIGILAHTSAPYIVDSAAIWVDMPLLIITVISLVCSIIPLFLPETVGYDMPQTMEDGENFGKDQHFCTWPWSNRQKSRQKSENNL